MASVVELYDKFTAGFADKAGKPPVTVCSLVITPRPPFPSYHPAVPDKAGKPPVMVEEGANPNPSPNPNPTRTRTRTRTRTLSLSLTRS